jgi:2'-5' RNA ligase
MERQKKILAYWLCPAQPARGHLAKMVRNLAGQFDAPVFEPHVTIYVTDAKHETPEAVLQKVLKARQPFELAVAGLNYSGKFTKTLFVQFASNPKLTHLSEDLRRASTAQDDYQLNPHLSLLYKEMDEETKRELTTSIALPFGEVSFDTVKAIISPAEIKSRREVEAWRVVAEHQLRE